MDEPETTSPTIASLRRLYHHMVHGGQITREDETRTGIEPLSLSALAHCIETMERAENAE